MKIFTWLMTAALLCSTQISHADDNCNLCDFDICNVTYAVYADYLYWQPCRSDLDYSHNPETQGSVNPNYNSGYRVGAVLSYDIWDLGVNYTSLCSKESRSAEDGNIKYKLDYQVVNIQLARAMNCGCDQAVFTPFIGTKLAWIDETFDTSDNLGVNSSMDHVSYGLFFGSHLRWDICSFETCDCSIPIALVSRGSFGIQHGTVSQKEEDFTYRDVCLSIPVIEAFIGLDLTFCDLFCGTNGNLQIGYEAQNFGSFREFNSSDNIASFGVNGLVTRFGLSF